VAKALFRFVDTEPRKDILSPIILGKRDLVWVLDDNNDEK